MAVGAAGTDLVVVGSAVVVVGIDKTTALILVVVVMVLLMRSLEQYRHPFLLTEYLAK